MKIVKVENAQDRKILQTKISLNDRKIEGLERRIRELRETNQKFGRMIVRFENGTEVDAKIAALGVSDELSGLATRVYARSMQVKHMREAKYAKRNWWMLRCFVTEGIVPPRKGVTASYMVTGWCTRVMAQDTAAKSELLCDEVDQARRKELAE